VLARALDESRHETTRDTAAPNNLLRYGRRVTKNSSARRSVAVRVHVSSADELPVDRVTAELSHERDCAVSLESDASAYGIYRCTEQGGGSYTIRVYSGDKTWSTNVRVTANECHTLEIKDVEISLDPASADHDD
jgi:hypothetical protein